MPDIEQVKQKQRALWAMGNYPRIAELFRDEARATVEAARICSGDSVLDVAAGNGNIAVEAARRGARVVATDFSPRMVELGRERSSAEGFDIEWREADAEDLPFGEGRFDVVTSSFGAMFAPRPEQAAAEMFRVAKPGGRVVMTNWVPDGAMDVITNIMRSYLPGAADDIPNPMEWGDRDTAHGRFAPYSEDVSFVPGAVRWEFEDWNEQREFLTEAAPPVAAAKALLDPDRFEELCSELEVGYRNLSIDPPRVVYDGNYVIVIGTKKR